MILGVDGILSLRLATECSGQDKTMSFICDLLCNVIEQLGPANIFSVVMEYIKNICGSKEEIQMQRNEMGGVGVQHVTWDEDFFEKSFAQA